MIRVFICDDHKLVSEGISLMLGNDTGISVCGSCGSAEDLLELIASDGKLFDILLLDINLPGMNGIEACRIIKQQSPSFKIIALSMLKELSLVKLMLKNGAEGYLVKNAGKTEIITAIQTISEGKKYMDEELRELLLNDMTGMARPKKSTELIPSLSRREKEILHLIMEEYTAGEIAGKLFISTGTVETHRRNMLAKLGARNTAGLVRMAMEYNLLAN